MSIIIVMIYYIAVNNKNKLGARVRKERDSNPRYNRLYNGLAIRRFSPLGHLSELESIYTLTQRESKSLYYQKDGPYMEYGLYYSREN